MSVEDLGAGGIGDLLRVLVDSAEAFLERGAAADAIRCSEQVLRLESVGEVRARALRVRGRIAAQEGTREEAHDCLREAVEIFVALADHPRAAECLNDLGESYRRQGDLAQARASLETSLQYSAAQKPGPTRARTLEELGTVHRLRGEIGPALDVLFEAKRIREAQRDSVGLARACRSLGNALYQSGRFEEALAEHGTALAIAEALGDQLEIGTALNNVGLAQIELGRNEDAERSLRRAHGIFVTLAHPKMVAFAATNLGLLASYRGDTEEARKHLEEALAIQDREQTRAAQAAILDNLANVAIMAGDEEAAIVHADRAIALLAELGRTEGLAAAWFARGRATLELGRASETEQAIVRLRELAEASARQESECDALLLSAELALTREPGTALPLAVAAREIAEEADLKRHAAEAARLVGEARMRSGDEAQAREDLLVAERAFKDLQSQYHLALTRRALGQLFQRAGSWEAAANRLRAAVEASARMGHDRLHWSSLLGLAEAQWPISRRLARQTLFQAEATARRAGRGDREEEVRALRDDLASGRSGSAELASQTVPLLARLLRRAESGDDAILGALRGLHDLLDLEAVAFFPAAAAAALGSVWTFASHPAPTESGGGDVAPDVWAARHGGVAEEATVLGAQDICWGRCVAAVAGEGGEERRALRAALQAAADLLGFALDGWAAGGATGAGPDAGARSGDLAVASESGVGPGGSAILGRSARILAILDTVERVAPTDSSVLLLGESGTGKELLARRLHELSRRAGRPFEAIACPSIPRDLIEAELFGHERGAFTGADRQRPGRIELAEGGTLFLDEIGDIDLATQSKLLRFLQEREFSRVGGRETVRVDVRIVAATSRELEREIEEGRFREDLFYRLSVVPILVPPLRDRGDDVVVLARQLLAEFTARAGKRLEFAPATLEALRRYTWPGNVRELRNLVEYLVAISSHGRLDPGALPVRIRESLARRDSDASAGILRSGETLDARLMALEGEIIRRALDAAGGNQSEAARVLGITESKLRHRLRRYGLATARRARAAARSTRPRKKGTTP